MRGRGCGDVHGGDVGVVDDGLRVGGPAADPVPFREVTRAFCIAAHDMDHVGILRTEDGRR